MMPIKPGDSSGNLPAGMLLLIIAILFGMTINGRGERLVGGDGMTRLVEGLLAKIRHPVLKRMVALWDAKRDDGNRHGRDWPLRDDFDPLEFWFAVGYVSLIEVEFQPRRRYFFRVDGTRQVELFGVECTGRYLDEAVTPEGAALAEESYGAAVATGAPQYHVRDIEFQGRLIRYEVAVLPMSRRGDRVDMLMTVVTPDTAT